MTSLTALIAQTGPRFRTATEYVEVTLRQGILSGALAGGTPLRQEELAEAFGVSRMPVREALRQLEAQALVDFVPHKGAVVTEISAADGADNYAIRLGLEPVALRLSIPHLDDGDFAQARALIDEMDGESDPGRIGELNKRFHLTLYGRAGRPRLLALIDHHLAVADRYVRFHMAAMGRGELSQADHRDLLAACQLRDVAGATAIAERHMTVAEQALTRFLSGWDQPLR